MTCLVDNTQPYNGDYVRPVDNVTSIQQGSSIIEPKTFKISVTKPLYVLSFWYDTGILWCLYTLGGQCDPYTTRFIHHWT